MDSATILAKVHAALDSGAYRFAPHAMQRLQQRFVSIEEVKQALKAGYHEKKKDEFKEEHSSWNYAIRGTTLDNRRLRIPVTFDETGTLIVTVIDLET